MTDRPHILIVEDEPPVARYIEKCCRAILRENLGAVSVYHTLRAASDFIHQNRIDLCLLDLNLRGEDGYDLLREAAAGSFHTIIISAYTDQAVEAFKYGVLDFVVKPFEEEDLRKSLDRYFGRVKERTVATQFLSARKGNTNVVIPLEQVVYFKAADIYVEAHLREGGSELLNKTMDRLERILPSRFFRIHRSYIVDISEIQSYTPVQGGTSCVELCRGEKLPLSRRRYKELNRRLKATRSQNDPSDPHSHDFRSH